MTELSRICFPGPLNKRYIAARATDVLIAGIRTPLVKNRSGRQRHSHTAILLRHIVRQLPGSYFLRGVRIL